MSYRYGITVPFDTPLNQQRDLYREFADLGYTDLWSSEADGTDGFTPLILASQWAPELRLGVAIIPAFTRGPALMAQHIASMCEAAPGRFVMGIGSSSNVIVEHWNGIPFEEPYKRTRDMVRFLRAALTGEKVSQEFDEFEVKGFTLRRVPPTQPPILIAALRAGMLRLAGPNPDAEIVRAGAKRAIAAYLNVPVYADFHRWLGRSDDLDGMWSAWSDGERKAALDAIPDHVVDELIVHGHPEECREHIDRYHEMGVTTSTVSIMPFGDIDPVQAARDLAPAAR